MSTDEDFGLGDMFKHLNFMQGKNVNEMLGTLMRNVQIRTLKQMRKMIDDNIKILTSADAEASPNIDPYEILGVKPDATKDEIQKAYRKKSFAAHPDHGGSNKKMILVNAAFEVISKFRGWK